MNNSVLVLLSRFLLITFAVVFTSACGSYSQLTVSSVIPDFETKTGVLTSELAAASVEDYGLLTVSKVMTDYFDPHISESMNQHQRIQQLKLLLDDEAFLNTQYQANATLTAEQAFLSRKANCVGFTNLIIALARHYGINAKYQLVRKFPEISRHADDSGQVMSLGIHINSLLKLSNGQSLVFDVSTNVSQQLGSFDIISDQTAKVLHYNNLAMEKFFQKEYVKAYEFLAKAMTFDASVDISWVNLGAVYRHNGQLEEAEAAYKAALKINRDSYTAMNNLAVLYQLKQDWQQFDLYLEKTKSYRLRNPYYHLDIALQAEENHDYTSAIKSMHKAIKLKNNEPEFYQVLSRLYSLSSAYSVRADLKKKPSMEEGDILYAGG